MTYISIKHGEQKRKSNNLPYIIHPIRVAAILRSFGFSEQIHEDLMIAALFHDLVEDTDTLPEEIRKNYNEKIMKIVNEVSKPRNENKEFWLNSFEIKSDEAKIIKMADRIDNLMDITKMNWTIERKRQYIEHAKIIFKKCGNAHEKLAKTLETLIKKLIGEIE